MTSRQVGVLALVVAALTALLIWQLTGPAVETPTPERSPGPADAPSGISTPGVAPSVGLAVPKPTGHPVTVRVVDPLTPRPLAGARVSLTTHAERPTEPMAAAADVAGLARFESVAVGQWKVRASHPGFVDGLGTFDVPARGAVPEITVRLVPNGWLAGRVVVPPEASAATLRVVLVGPLPGRSEVLLDAGPEQTFSRQHLLPGAYEIHAAAVSPDGVRWSASVSTPSAEGYYELVLEARSPSVGLDAIRGVVVTKEDVPLAHARVWWRSGAQGRPNLLIANERGEFAVEALPMGGYTFTAYHAAEVMPKRPEWISERAVTLQPGGEPQSIVLDLRDAIEVRLDGDVVEGVTVSVIPTDAGAGAVVERAPDADGVFRFWGLPDDSLVNVYARDTTGRAGFAQVRMARTTRTVKLHMAEGVTISGAVVVPAGVDPATLKVEALGFGSDEVRVAATTVEAGRFEIRGLVRHLWRVTAAGTSGSVIYRATKATQAPATDLQLVLLADTLQPVR
jgi:hypothetical protein